MARIQAILSPLVALLKLGGKAGAVLSLAGVTALGVLWLRYGQEVELVDVGEIGTLRQRSVVYDGDGRVEAYIDGESRFVVPLSGVAPVFLRAVVAQEDARFWEHAGVDVQGIGRAAWMNLRSGAVKQGGSTLTQQVARNAYGLSERTLGRKLHEALLARRLEQELPKTAILEDYVNRVYFGAGAYGVERAARVFFGRSARELRLSQAALLAALIRSPNRLNPTRNPQEALAARDALIFRMVLLGAATPAEGARALREPLGTREDRALPYPEGYGLDAVRRELALVVPPEKIALGGLRIYTTLDPTLQAVAEKALENQLAGLERQRWWKHPRRSAYEPAPEGKPQRPTRYVQGALVVVENGTGAIRVLVGGRDYMQSRYDRASLARRQPGSTFKPFIYALAFEGGMLPGSLVDDSRIAPGEFPDIPKNWSPANSDGAYGGFRPAALGLVKSRNTMSVRVGEYVGLPKVRERVARMGLELPPYPAAFLGGFETTLRALTAAYTVFPNGGRRVSAHLIARVEDAYGRVLYRAPTTSPLVLGSPAAVMTSQLLEQVLKVGTGSRAQRYGLRKAAAGKTGTSNDFRDAWFIGYTRSLTCGVWVGLDKPQPIMARGFGGTLALPIWVEVVQMASEQRYPAGPLFEEVPYVRVALCAGSNLLAAPGCQHAGLRYLSEVPVALCPQRRCTLHERYIPVLTATPVEPPPVGER